MSRLRAAAVGVLLVAAATAAAWAVAFPQVVPATAATRALADCAAVVTLGLAVVPLLDTGRRRGELARTAAGPLAVSAGCWLLAEVVRLAVQGAQLVGVPVWRLRTSTVVEYATVTAAGRSALLSIAAAATVAGLALAAHRRSAAWMVAIGAAAAGMLARTLTGHLAASPVGGAAVAVHALAAALWCGVLAALVLTVAHRGRWARVLPRFSQVSLWCVIVLLVCGVAGAAVTLASPAALFDTGYGRVLSGKIAVTVALIGLAWRNRTGWVPAARAHRTTAEVSTARSLTELALMTVALTFAAVLTVTG
ncbi:CopD family protein [Mycolicibacterium thermoresistibile]|uniref:Copper resistance D domain-containing protein n=2 Tax=Mycolicibacterium thermoresistibile TaxID=1797 RepID=G7CCU4_MYCT3|nr:CopD family protein [Mycolicibacterium thermoresistibile]EHI14193.1 copper resistance D domain-containing protein [Mycolicibacterium thermoresistibile ATCC 19527]GAT16508.1 copper resistance D domain-containing protein [Mycolicibacterium thermoresistibile]SNW20575.1 putative copper export protein [Mycolicibacterium thermoresistibile]